MLRGARSRFRGNPHDPTRGKPLQVLLRLQWQLIVRRGWLNLVTFFCEYMGSIVNYAAIGLVLCSGA